MTAPCRLLVWQPSCGSWRPCGRPGSGEGAAGQVLCGGCFRELARLKAAGLDRRVRFAPAQEAATSAPPAPAVQAALELPPDPPPAPRPWEQVRFHKVRKAGEVR